MRQPLKAGVSNASQIFDEMIGNFDAHVKNFSLLYETATAPCLSPTYDIVAYSGYLAGEGNGLKFFPDSKEREKLLPAIVRRLANFLGIPEKALSKVIADTVSTAVAKWPKAIRRSELSRLQKINLLTHFKHNPSVEALRKRKKAACLRGRPDLELPD
ncbi:MULTISPECIES: HipA domain-containing protein [unclassified Undibacterium]|uniref:HipA domain-containing protein n=1 Tax=unclassified Undibacterium TaxID=2630295 RepID=UPI002AC90369|nr:MULTISPECIES: HipA domain-containing protein [unclassified Undibacterium]MEB0138891.1 HipA domain-containing protein [Undibacterium sp. CCC2.1]MEB0171778.1 HipA domain-containing protein [Undibacterium sp. CCC1.1]MEB0175522.1 HipA domain-containing protein [Undibacterium sp. CCC3.4]MEB0214980.1 HipA domain-containing protein [Undibacterium sp. 5I2]WPX44962.1 HipA domain-containing protein [Undibacterium sp. CCC3.4]